MLSDAGYTVLAPESPADALSAIESDTPDLMLTDVVMPGMSGIELARAARVHSPGVRVMFMSGYHEWHAGVAEGGTLIRKPFTPSLLLSRISQVFDSN